MRRKLSLLSIVSLILLMLMGGTAKAQDARAVLQAAVKSMGTDSLKCITYWAPVAMSASWARVTPPAMTGQKWSWRISPGPSTSTPEP